MSRAATVHRFFVTATDTGVGKTEVSCALLTLMRERGLRPAAFKPYESGVKARGRPADAVRLWDASGRIDPLEHVVLHTFREPLAPGVAAVREKRSISFAQTMSGFHRFDGRALVAEGAGGLLVPIDSKRDVIDLIEATNLPVILVARAGLGTLNHTLLSLRLLDERAIPVRAVLLMKSTPARDPSEKDNAEWIRRRSGAFVIGPIPYLKNPRALSARLQRELAPLISTPSRTNR